MAQDEDTSMFAQIDGGEWCATLAEALERAKWKITFTTQTGERVRLIRYGLSERFVLRPFVDDLREELAARGVAEPVMQALLRSYAEAVTSVTDRG